MSSSSSSTTHTTISIYTPSRVQDATMPALALSRALPRTAMALSSSTGTLSRLSMGLLLLATLSYICTWGELDHQVLHAHSSHATVAAHDAQHCA